MRFYTRPGRFVLYSLKNLAMKMLLVKIIGGEPPIEPQKYLNYRIFERKRNTDNKLPSLCSNSDYA